MMTRSEAESIALEIDDIAVLLRAYGLDEIASDLELVRQRVVAVPCRDWTPPVLSKESSRHHC